MHTKYRGLHAPYCVEGSQHESEICRGWPAVRARSCDPFKPNMQLLLNRTQGHSYRLGPSCDTRTQSEVVRCFLFRVSFKRSVLVQGGGDNIPNAHTRCVTHAQPRLRACSLQARDLFKHFKFLTRPKVKSSSSSSSSPSSSAWATLARSADNTCEAGVYTHV